MKKIILALTVAVAVFGGQIEVDVGGHPESVLVDTKRVYVANVGKELKPMDKDGDGYISLLNKKGEIVNKNFLTGLNAPKGMALVGNTLYVADVDEVRGFDIVSKKQTFSLVFEGVKFLNDIAAKDARTLYVTGTDSGKVYEVNIKTKKVKPIADLPSANGIIYEKGRLYGVELSHSSSDMFGGGGKMYEIDTKTGALTQLGKVEGVLDGIQKVGDIIYYSDWIKFEKTGIVRTYNLKTKAESELSLDKIGGPADFWIDKKEHKIWIPKMIEGKVLIVDLK